LTHAELQALLGLLRQEMAVAPKTSEQTALARDVEARFRMLPRCPQALTVASDGTGNILIELHGRTFTISALVIDRTMMDAVWCDHVLTLVFGVPGERVSSLIRRALISAKLTEGDLNTLRALELGPMAVSTVQADYNQRCMTLAADGLINLFAPPGGEARWVITDAGKDALEAHRP
jgi:hypothetical protein